MFFFRELVGLGIMLLMLFYKLDGHDKCYWTHHLQKSSENKVQPKVDSSLGCHWKKMDVETTLCASWASALSSQHKMTVYRCIYHSIGYVSIIPLQPAHRYWGGWQTNRTKIWKKTSVGCTISIWCGLLCKKSTLNRSVFRLVLGY